MFPGGRNISCSWGDDGSEINSFPHLPSSHSAPSWNNGNEKKCKSVETKTRVYQHFHVCLTLGDVESFSQRKLFNRWNKSAICFKWRLRPPCLLPHIKSVFHINWMFYGVTDKLQSGKRQNEQREEKPLYAWTMSCLLLLHLCSHICIFFWQIRDKEITGWIKI